MLIVARTVGSWISYSIFGWMDKYTPLSMIACVLKVLPSEFRQVFEFQVNRCAKFIELELLGL